MPVSDRPQVHPRRILAILAGSITLAAVVLGPLVVVSPKATAASVLDDPALLLGFEGDLADASATAHPVQAWA